MAIFKLYECDFGVTINGVNYDFPHVESLAIDNPERTRLIRGGNAGNKIGLEYVEGIKEAKVTTLTAIGLPMAIHALLKAAYDAKTRLDWYAISRADGSSKIGKNSILSQEPMQLSLDDTAESMNVALVFESFDVSEVHKS